MNRRRAQLALSLAVVAAVGCAGSDADEVADLCRDLGSFRATFALLLAPPPDATVGEVRGALEKVAPFLGRISDSDATPRSLDDAIDEAETSFRDGLDGLGDDEPASVAERALARARPRMADAVEAAASSLACDAPRPAPGGSLPAEPRATV